MTKIGMVDGNGIRSAGAKKCIAKGFVYVKQIDQRFGTQKPVLLNAWPTAFLRNVV
jgi:hypothetical protein